MNEMERKKQLGRDMNAEVSCDEVGTYTGRDKSIGYDNGIKDHKRRELKLLETMRGSHEKACDFLSTKLRVMKEQIQNEKKVLSALKHERGLNVLEGTADITNEKDIAHAENEVLQLQNELSHWNRFNDIFHTYKNLVGNQIDLALNEVRAWFDKNDAPKAHEQQDSPETHNHD